MLKYFDKNISTDSLQSYSFLSKEGTVIYNVQDDICFRHITLDSVPKETVKILIFKNLNKIPYKFETIEKWIKEIDDMGFFCKVELDNENKRIIVTLELKNFQNKGELVFTLQLVRALWEVGICIVPEIYFSLIEKEGELDKFDLLQTAHKKLKEYADYGSMYADTNHMITSSSNAYNISKNEYKNKLKNSFVDIHSHKYNNWHSLFAGNKPKGEMSFDEFEVKSVFA